MRGNLYFTVGNSLFASSIFTFPRLNSSKALTTISSTFALVESPNCFSTFVKTLILRSAFPFLEHLVLRRLLDISPVAELIFSRKPNLNMDSQ